ncbi:MAG: hypothetical protein ACP5I1_19210, partial [Candidatus Hinthialibacter sp.]
FVVSLLNPYHIDIYRHIYNFAVKDFIFAHTQDLHPLIFQELTDQTIFLYIFYGLFILHYQKESDKILSYTTFIGMSLLSLKSIRHTPLLLAISILPVVQSTSRFLLSPPANSIWRKMSGVILRSSKRMEWTWQKRFSSAQLAAIILVLITLSFLASPVGKHLPRQKVPIDAMQIMNSEKAFHGQRGFNEYGYGSYLSLEAPQCIPYVHSLNAIYPEQRFKNYGTIEFCRYGWKELFLEENFIWVLIEPKSILNKGLAEVGDYRKIHEDSLSVLYLRKDYVHLLEDPKFDEIKKQEETAE